jgi:hypothetical protein
MIHCVQPNCTSFSLPQGFEAKRGDSSHGFQFFPFFLFSFFPFSFFLFLIEDDSKVEIACSIYLRKKNLIALPMPTASCAIYIDREDIYYTPQTDQSPELETSWTRGFGIRAADPVPSYSGSK